MNHLQVKLFAALAIAAVRPMSEFNVQTVNPRHEKLFAVALAAERQMTLR